MSSRIARSLGSAFLLAAALAAAPFFVERSSASTFTEICKFGDTASCNGNGFTPTAGMLVDSSGNIFGTLSQGGPTTGVFHDTGVVFEITAGGTYKEIYNFCAMSGCSDGAFPAGNLIMDTSGNLYGVTTSGGTTNATDTSGDGVVYKLSPPTGGGTLWTETVLYDFCSIEYGCSTTNYDGANPQAGLAYSGQSSGSLYNGTAALYGTTSNGGSSSGRGTVFQLKKVSGTWTETRVHDFCSCGTPQDGYNPSSNITVDSSGNLYGTARGGSSGGGVAFELTKTAGVWNETILYTFCTTGGSGCPDGQSADASGVSIDGSGTIWGNTTLGGHYDATYAPNGGGVLYKLATTGTYCSASNGTLCDTVVYAFCQTTNASGCTDGRQPSKGTGPLFIPGSSPLVVYGTTEDGGAHQQGIMYAISLGFHDVHDFCSGGTGCPDGADPNGGLSLDSSGTLYGTTQGGGVGTGYGTAFKFVP